MFKCELGSPETHPVYVCAVHQNVKLLIETNQIEETYKVLIVNLVFPELANIVC